MPTSSCDEVSILIRIRPITGNTRWRQLRGSQFHSFMACLTDCGKAQKFSVISGKRPSGPKGPVAFIGVMRGLKPPPPSGSSFSAAYETGRFRGSLKGFFRSSKNVIQAARRARFLRRICSRVSRRVVASPDSGSLYPRATAGCRTRER